MLLDQPERRDADQDESTEVARTIGRASEGMLFTSALAPSSLGWAILYLTFRSAWATALGIANTRQGATAAWVWSCASADICASILVLTWWHPAARPLLGALVLPLFLYLLFFETVAAVIRFYGSLTEATDATDEPFTSAGLLRLLSVPALVAWEILAVAPPLLAGAALSFMV
jgi:hypothetical protein